MFQCVFAPTARRVLIVIVVLSCPRPLLGQSGTIGLNFTGATHFDGALFNGTTYAPPDNNGAVGPNNLVQLINGIYAVYNKTTGAEQQFMSGADFWSAAHVDPGTGLNGLGAFNARILYDPTVNRWIAAALTSESTDNKVMIGRSNTADPTGGWEAVSFVGNVGGPGRFVDFTTLGVDANGVYIGTQNFQSISGNPVNRSLFSLPKADLLAGVPSLSRLSRFDGIASSYGNNIQPIIDFGPAKTSASVLAGTTFNPAPTLVRANLTGTSGAGASLSSVQSVTVNTQYSFPPFAAQPDGTRTINTIDSRLCSNVYQVGNIIYVAHETKVGNNSAIVWHMIDEQTNTVIQDGVISDPNFDYFQPSIAANANGNIVIGFTRSGLGAGGNLSIYAVVGKTTGGTTTFGTPFLIKASTVNNYHQLTDRWGDWSTTVVDPSNPLSFWTFQQYAIDSSDWATQITQIIVPEPEGIVLAAIAMTALLAAASRRRRRAGA